jgi:parallel beta-helix repeat protein
VRLEPSCTSERRGHCGGGRGRGAQRAGLLLAATVLLVLAAAAPALAFTDVEQDNNFIAAITDLNQRKVIEGYDDGTFRPDNQVRRQHFAKMIVLSLGFPVSETDISTFKDVPKGGPEDFYPDNYIAVCAKNGITTGYDGTPTGRFGPEDPIRRTQLVTMVVRAAENFGNVTLAEPDQEYLGHTHGLAAFQDKDHGRNVHVADYNGLLRNMLWIDPAEMYEYATRAEVAQILYNLVHVCQIDAVHVNVGGGGDYPTLQAAVAAVPANTLIVLGPGTYTLPATLAVEKSLHLVGVPGDTVVRCAGDVFRVTGPDVVFSAMGVTFEHAGTATGDVGVVVDAVFDLYDCVFRGGVYNASSDAGGDGLWIWGTSAGEVYYCISGNNDYCGIDVSGDAYARINYNTCLLNGRHGILFSGRASGHLILNTCQANEQSGIVIQDESDVWLADNECLQNGQAGMVLMDSALVSAEDDTCAENELTGIIVAGEADVELDGVLCEGNGADGLLFLSTSTGIVTNSQFFDNGASGVSVTNQAEAALIGNECAGNLAAGILFKEQSTGTAEDNECYDNRWGLVVASTADPILTGNYLHDNTDLDLADQRD